MATVYEAVELLKDFIYLDKFPHYSWWTVLILTYALLASISLGLLQIYQNSQKQSNTNGFWEEFYLTVFGRTLTKQHSNQRRKLLKYTVQFPNHYFVFYFESFLLGNNWSLFQYVAAIFSFISLAKTSADFYGHKDG